MKKLSSIFPRTKNVRCLLSAVGRQWTGLSPDARGGLLQPSRIKSLLILLAIASLWFCPAFSLAQSNIKIEGHIYDQDDGHPISKATVKIANTNYECSSDNSGYFFFEKIPVGTYSVNVLSPGYESHTISPVTVSEDVTTRIDVQLQKKTYFLPGVEV
ncbi:MAG: carboxypeptidase regulatory-like domain-containing protein, partial [candidate division Zixibacteria bacterium]|nr:carboxypeptidase regulatory-like domain-containing protein [candidate division Zixibacteria bacterium]